MADNASSYITNRRQLYILPTRTGLIFGLLILVLLVTAIRYNHQATYLLTFILAAIGQVTSLYTHRNLLGLSISAHSNNNVFCKQDSLFTATLNNPTKTERPAVWVISGDHKTPCTLKPNSQHTIDIAIKTEKRGKLNLPPIILSSHYPIGILFSWTKAFKAQTSCIVYPEPKNLLPFPEAVEDDSANQHSSTVLSKKGADELSHTRPYQEGDQPRDIHWQAYAKHQQLVSRVLTSETTPKTELNWLQVNTLNTEDKLSQLTQWILDAEQLQTEYQLNIPGFSSPQSKGARHMNDCLTALALWGLDKDYVESDKITTSKAKS